METENWMTLGKTYEYDSMWGTWVLECRKCGEKWFPDTNEEGVEWGDAHGRWHMRRVNEMFKDES